MRRFSIIIMSLWQLIYLTDKTKLIHLVKKMKKEIHPRNTTTLFQFIIIFQLQVILFMQE